MKWTRVTLSFIGLIMFAQSASAQTMQTTFASQPVFPNSVNPSTYLYHIEPGGSIEDEILIKNLSDQPQELRLYPVDGQKGSGSEGEPSFSYRAGGLEMTEVGTWLSFGLEDNPLTFKPNETKKFTFIISIPKEVEQKTYHGGIALEQLFLPKDGTVATALRKIEKVEIKVTNNPQEIPKMELQTNIFGTNSPFQWITFAIFSICFLYLISSAVKSHAAKKRKTD